MQVTETTTNTERRAIWVQERCENVQTSRAEPGPCLDVLVRETRGEEPSDSWHSHSELALDIWPIPSDQNPPSSSSSSSFIGSSEGGGQQVANRALGHQPQTSPRQSRAPVENGVWETSDNTCSLFC